MKKMISTLVMLIGLVITPWAWGQEAATGAPPQQTPSGTVPAIPGEPGGGATPAHPVRPTHPGEIRHDRRELRRDNQEILDDLREIRQDRQEIHQDLREIQQDRAKLREAIRSGDQEAISRARQELGQDYRESRGRTAKSSGTTSRSSVGIGPSSIMTKGISSAIGTSRDERAVPIGAGKPAARRSALHAQRGWLIATPLSRFDNGGVDGT